MVDGVKLLPLIVRYFKFCAVLIGIWLLGYYGFSTAWIMLGLFMYMSNNEYRRVKDAKRAFTKEAVLNEKAAILGRLEDLPAWVYFPDIEKAEWLNKIIKQMWPFIGKYTENILRTTVEPQVQNSLPKSLTPFKFEKIDMGDIPPRIGGVKVYIDQVKRTEIIMDMELIFFSDCDIKVAVRGISAGIKDLQIQGTIRVEMKPLLNVMPIIGGMNVFFMNNPKIDFDLTNTANILDVPLLSHTLRGVVSDQISYHMVLPNKIPIHLADVEHLTALKYHTPQGVLRINVIAGRELKAADINLLGKNKSDPYCKIYIGAQSFKTKTINGTITPVWNQYFEAVVDQKEGQVVELNVLDEDPGEDDELGSASLDINTICKQGSIDTWLPLEDVTTGMIHVRAVWLHLSRDPEDLPKEKRLREIRSLEKLPPELVGAISSSESALVGTGSEQHLSSALLLVHLDSAKNLPRSKKGMSEPSPYVKLKIGNDERKSVPQQNTTNPTWETNYEFLIHDPHMQDLNVEVIDSKKKGKKLGSISYSLKDLLTCTDLTTNRAFNLSGTADASVSLRLCLRLLTSERPESWAIDDGVREPDQANVLDSVAAMSTPHPAQTVASGISGEEENSVTESMAELGTFGAEIKGTNEKSDVEDISHSKKSDSLYAERSGENLRHRSATTSSVESDSGLGRIRATVRYSKQRQKLILVVHNCVNLIPCDDDHLADPYVRIHVLPEKSSSNKRKTEVCKNNLNPVFDATEEWSMTLAEASAKTLELTVKNEVGLFSKSRKVMGVALIELAQFDLSNATTAWFDLTSEDDD